jgi:hypothetical protein
MRRYWSCRIGILFFPFLRAAPRKYQPKRCKIKKSKILKFCLNNPFGSLINEINSQFDWTNISLVRHPSSPRPCQTKKIGQKIEPRFSAIRRGNATSITKQHTSYKRQINTATFCLFTKQSSSSRIFYRFLKFNLYACHFLRDDVSNFRVR